MSVTNFMAVVLIIVEAVYSEPQMPLPKSLGYIVGEPLMPQPIFVRIHPGNTEMCNWISEDSDLLVALEEVRRIHPLGTMNICTKCHGNPSTVVLFQSGKW